jgi:Pectinacetylesterase
LNSGSGITGPDPRSPLKDWSVLYVPYCTADVHSGNNTADYGLYKIHHRGRVNVEDALLYAVKAMPNPSEVATIGCSAGSLGAFINAPYVMHHFPNARTHYVWGDSEVGILTSSQYDGAWNNWHMQLAPFVPRLAENYTRNYTPAVVGYIVVESAKFFSNSTWAAYCSDFDLVESSYYKLGGGKGDWTTLMRDQFKQVHANSTNVMSYIAPGGAHCVSDNDNYWNVKSDSVLLSNWIEGLLNGTRIETAVDCTPNCL